MQGEAEVEAPRARPLSGGLWTLFSWLRRDERASSSDSLSSAGSARTAASFAFLPPNYYRSPNPLVLPPPGPPTDSYKKRLKDRNQRRHHERGLTLHRKYGLHRAEEGGYEASSLPCPRERRAASEGLPRPAQHVPGKRRAPPPPAVAVAATLPRRSRKRRAPQPPINIDTHLKENFISIRLHNSNTPKPMNESRLQSLTNNESTDCKSEKYKKSEVISKTTKNKSDKSFLKQLFDNKKRNSAIDTSSVKVLPSISELDKQAAEIIESCKQKALERNSMSSAEQRQTICETSPTTSKGEAWICTTCLRKYNLSVNTCEYCVQSGSTSLQKDNASKITAHATNTSTQTNIAANATPVNRAMDEKQKLKEMLKEMKDSLPKRPKHEINQGRLSVNIETPTLRIGSSVMIQDKSDTQPIVAKPEESRVGSKHEEKQLTTETNVSFTKSVVVSQPVVLTHVITHLGSSSQQADKRKINNNNTKVPTGASKLLQKENDISTISNTPSASDKSILHTPLKISSLLNPVYIPISSTSNKHISSNRGQTVIVPDLGKKQNNVEDVTNSITINSNATTSNGEKLTNDSVMQKKPHVEPVNETVASIVLASRPLIKDKILIPSSPKPSSIKSEEQEPSDIVERLDQHARRRVLVNQLEKSIAGGDERAAAEAAVKLAQLRLSCSVLSFSSQIVAEPSTSSSNLVKKNETNKYVSAKTSEPKIVNSEEQLKLTKGDAALLDKHIDRNTGSTPENIKPTKSPNPKLEETGQSKPSTSKQANDNKEDNTVLIVVWIEDKEAARGPINLRIQRKAIMKDLRKQAETSLGIESRLQRWIVGQVLCTDDNTPLVSLAGTYFNAPFYLCLVESDTNAVSNVPIKQNIQEDNDAIDKAGKVYSELMKLEQQAVVPNTETFECDVCMENCAPNRGVVLRECVHTFCIDCLSYVIRHSEEPVISCPATACPGLLQEREIRALVSPEEYERWLARGLAAAESGTRNAFHCRTRDCTGWALCEPGVRQFPCPVCKHTNCVPCQAIHEGETCEQNRAKLEEAAKTTDSNVNDESTRALLDTLIKKGEALECPECSAIITKKWGCDWVKCSACKTEICWVTRGRRWGPNGRGDTSAGCRCGIDGKRCHPSCGYCH